MTPELKRLRITNIVLGILTAVVGMHFNQGMANYGSVPRITIYTRSIHFIKLFTASQQVMRHGILRKISRDIYGLSLIHISEPTRLLSISYAVFCLKKKK